MVKMMNDVTCNNTLVQRVLLRSVTFTIALAICSMHGWSEDPARQKISSASIEIVERLCDRARDGYKRLMDYSSQISSKEKDEMLLELERMYSELYELYEADAKRKNGVVAAIARDRSVPLEAVPIFAPALIEDVSDIEPSVCIAKMEKWIGRTSDERAYSHYISVLLRYSEYEKAIDFLERKNKEDSSSYELKLLLLSAYSNYDTYLYGCEMKAQKIDPDEMIQKDKDLVVYDHPYLKKAERVALGLLESHPWLVAKSFDQIRVNNNVAKHYLRDFLLRAKEILERFERERVWELKSVDFPSLSEEEVVRTLKWVNGIIQE